jgi:hypothetical protein
MPFAAARTTKSINLPRERDIPAYNFQQFALMAKRHAQGES